jgi:hypothetical protein
LCDVFGVDVVAIAQDMVNDGEDLGLIPLDHLTERELIASLYLPDKCLFTSLVVFGSLGPSRYRRELNCFA